MKFVDGSLGMSSLPQGWHNVVGPSSTSNSVGLSGSSVPVTIRKKWNSPQASNVPPTKLPSRKSSNLRQPNCNFNSTYQMKSPLTPAGSQQTKLPTPTKPSPVKEYKDEIEKLKKELSTNKAENSILKAKVRRVNDDNDQKGRQIEKMRAEMKALQKNESASIKKSKESHELLLLRQKCLRLESVLKEKDLTIKKLTCESSRKEDSDSSKTPVSSTNKQAYRSTTSNQLRNSKNSERESLSAKSSQSRANLSLKTEVTKLRDMIHKLEKENQDLQQQAKLHCQEIRRLKVEVRSKTPSQNFVSKVTRNENLKTDKSACVLSTSNSQVNVPTKTNIQSSSVPKQKLPLPLPNRAATRTSAPAPNRQPALQKPNPQKSVPKRTKSPILPNGNIKQISSQKQFKTIPPKSSVMKSSTPSSASKTVVQKSIPRKSIISNNRRSLDIDRKVKEMRENNAAKKIQRSWREHQKSLYHSTGTAFQNEQKLQHSTEPTFQNEGKALTFIIST